MMSTTDELILVGIYFLLKYWKVWVVVIPVALVTLGYLAGGAA